MLAIPAASESEGGHAQPWVRASLVQLEFDGLQKSNTVLCSSVGVPPTRRRSANKVKVQLYETTSPARRRARAGGEGAHNG